MKMQEAVAQHFGLIARGFDPITGSAEAIPWSTYHVGQLAISRRIAGLDGAIKGPGQKTGPQKV